MNKENVLRPVAVGFGLVGVLSLTGCGLSTDNYETAIGHTKAEADNLGVTRVCLDALRDTKDLGAIMPTSPVVRTNCQTGARATPEIARDISAEREAKKLDERNSNLTGATGVLGLAALVGGFGWTVVCSVPRPNTPNTLRAL